MGESSGHVDYGGSRTALPPARPIQSVEVDIRVLDGEAVDILLKEVRVVYADDRRPTGLGG